MKQRVVVLCVAALLIVTIAAFPVLKKIETTIEATEFSSDLPGFDNLGNDSVAERYDAASGQYVLTYTTDISSYKSRTYQYEDFVFETLTRLPILAQQLSEPISADNLFTYMPTIFHFLSGTGGWQTELHFFADGTFSGTFQDTDAYETFRCDFEGAMQSPRRVDDLVYSTRVTQLNYEKPNIVKRESDPRIITAEPYGLNGADEILIYLPGYPVNKIPEEAAMWVQSAEAFQDGQGPDTLPFFVLYNVKEQLAFFSGDDWTAFPDTEVDQPMLTFQTGGIEERIPAIPYTEQNYSLYIPVGGWSLQQLIEEDTLIKRWSSGANSNVSLTVRRLGYRDLAAAQDWERTHSSKFSLVEDKQGGLFGEYNQNLLDIQFYQGQSTMYAVELRYPTVAAERFGGLLNVMADTFCLTTSSETLPGSPSAIVAPPDGEIQSALLANRRKNMIADGEHPFSTCAYQLLGQESQNGGCTVYALVMYADLDRRNGRPLVKYSFIYPAKLQFLREDDEWQCTDFQRANGSDDMEAFVHEQFPADLAKGFLIDADLEYELYARCFEAAESYYSKFL